MTERQTAGDRCEFCPSLMGYIICVVIVCCYFLIHHCTVNPIRTFILKLVLPSSYLSLVSPWGENQDTEDVKPLSLVSLVLFTFVFLGLNCSPGMLLSGFSIFCKKTCDNHNSLLCPFLQFSKQLWPLAFGKISFVVFILTSALSVTSLPADTEKGRRKVVHVLGEDNFYLSHFSQLPAAT